MAEGPWKGWETLDGPPPSVTGGQSTALLRLTDAFVHTGPRSVPFSPKAGYTAPATDRMDAGRASHRKRRKNKRSRAFINPEDFVIGESLFPAMFEVFFPAPRMGNPQGLQFTTQPVGSSHGLGTSPSAATHPTGPGRFMNVADGPTIKRQRPPRKRHTKLSVAKMVRGVLKGS